MQLSELKTYAEKLSKAFPQVDDVIRDLYFLAVDEVESGESETHECDLAISAMDQLTGVDEY
jgi:hypothetical protein|tara:strand:+ start:1583 stop:1768 length:186 start_codon:yes stop_codon:yes gene_type:complete